MTQEIKFHEKENAPTAATVEASNTKPNHLRKDSAMHHNATVLVFQQHHLDITDINNQPWLRLGQIGLALGYSNPADLQKVYNRNADEFDDSMTQVVELDTAGGRQPTRIFSLRGCHLLGMLARTEPAKAFRHWVLDVLADYAERGRRAASAKITANQAYQLRQAAALLAERTAEPPQSVYARFFRAFAIRQTGDLPATRFDEALEWLRHAAPPAAWHPQLTPDDVRYLREQGAGDTKLLNIAIKNRHLLPTAILLATQEG